jgi:hypothetical protein
MVSKTRYNHAVLVSGLTSLRKLSVVSQVVPGYIAKVTAYIKQIDVKYGHAMIKLYFIITKNAINNDIYGFYTTFD